MPDHPITFTDRARTLTQDWTRRAGLAVHRLGIRPNWITWAGTGVVAIGAVLAGSGQFQLAALVLLAGLPLDALDGAVARASNQVTKFGGVLDSTLDRYADGLIFGGLCYHFALQSQPHNVLLALGGLTGSFVVSYVRARAGEAGLSVKIGLFDRFVRVIVLLIGLGIPPLLLPALWLLAIGTNFTGLQRLWYVYRHIDKEG